MKLITSRKLLKLKSISHGFFNRSGGKSKGIYKSLNCGPGSDDKKSNVKKNLIIVKEKIGRNIDNIYLLNQTHGNKFIYLNKNYKFLKKRPKVDAVITNQKKLPIAILTADCAPILLYDQNAKIIAAIHSGWKGAYKNIVIKVLKKFIKLGSKIKHIVVAIGPTIRQHNYEVGKEFKDKFERKSKKNSIYFKFIQNRIYFDLPKFINNQLISFGIFKIDVIKMDTFDKKNNFFSARRSLKRNESDYGRNISVIMLK